MGTEMQRARGAHADRNAESHRRLMDAAMELIAGQGFERTTAAEIGERAGYSRNMVRDRYGSKEALLEALCEREFAERLLHLESAASQAEGLDRVLARVDGIVELVATEREVFRAVVVLAFEAAGPIPSIRQWWAEMIRRFEEAFAGDLVEGQRDGTVRADLDVKREAEVFVSYGAGLCYRWSLRQPEYDMVAELQAWRFRLKAAYAT